MSEREELLTDLKAIYGETHPHRDPERLRVSDDVQALGVLLRREFRALENLRPRSIEAFPRRKTADPE